MNLNIIDKYYCWCCCCFTMRKTQQTHWKRLQSESVFQWSVQNEKILQRSNVKGDTHIHACFNNTLEICQRFKEVFVQHQHAATTTTTTTIRSSCAELRKSSFCQKKNSMNNFATLFECLVKTFTWYSPYTVHNKKTEQQQQHRTHSAVLSSVS